MWMNANKERFGEYGNLFVPKQALFTALGENTMKGGTQKSRNTSTAKTESNIEHKGSAWVRQEDVKWCSVDQDHTNNWREARSKDTQSWIK